MKTSMKTSGVKLADCFDACVEACELIQPLLDKQNARSGKALGAFYKLQDKIFSYLYDTDWSPRVVDSIYRLRDKDYETFSEAYHDIVCIF